MTERPQNIIRKTISGKEYSCKKLPYRQARPLQLKLAAALSPMMGMMADGKGDMKITDALPALVGNLDFDLIIELCETCMVNGERVNVDSFKADEAEDLQVAALAVETHFVNFIKGLQSELGSLMPKGKPTKS